MPAPAGRRTLLFAAAIVVIGAMSSPARAGTVAIILSAAAPAYEEAVAGLKQSPEFRAAGHRVVGTYDMKGDFDRGRQILQEIQNQVKPDLIVAVGIWALQLVTNQRTGIPVVYAMVLNPPSITGAAATNITGASMNISVQESFALLKELNPRIRRIGTVYEKQTTGYLIQEAQTIAKDMGLELVAKEADSPSEAIRAIKQLQDESLDALWMVPDKVALAPQASEQLLLLSYRKKIPLLGLSERQASMGATMSLSFASSQDIGAQAGALASQVLDGKNPSELPFTKARRTKLVVNRRAAAKLGIDVPESIMNKADEVIDE